LILSTGRGGEHAARELSKKVATCPHGTTATPVHEASRHLAAAERLYAAALGLHEAEEQIQRAMELLDLAANSASQAEALFERAAGLDDEARAGADEARETLGVEVPPAEMSVAGLATLADERARDGQRRLRGVAGGTARDLRSRLCALQDKIQTLRASLRDS
jgi:hypothetical protein